MFSWKLGYGTPDFTAEQVAQTSNCKQGSLALTGKKMGGGGGGGGMNSSS